MEGVAASTAQGPIGDAPNQTRESSRQAGVEQSNAVPSAIYLAAPQVTSMGLRISWEPVPSADEYVVEESDNREFENPKEVYRGSNTAYSPFLSTAPEVKKPGLRLMPEPAFMKPLSPTPSTTGFDPLTFRMRWFRVKAKCGLFVDSDWSEPVRFCY